MNEIEKRVVEIAEGKLQDLLGSVKTEAIRTKLKNLNEVCKKLVLAKQPLTVPSVCDAYASSYHAKDQALAKQSIRNKRDGANPYHALYEAWRSGGEVLLKKTHSRRKTPDGVLVDAIDIEAVKDPGDRHSMLMLATQNRSLKARLNALQTLDGSRVIQVVGAGNERERRTMALASHLSLDEVELAALREFIDERKMASRQLRVEENGSIVDRRNRVFADPGFVTAVSKIVRSYTPA